MKYQLVFSLQRNERNNYECGNPRENMFLLLLKEASGPRRSSLDLWRPLKTHRKTDTFFIQHLRYPIFRENKLHINMYLYHYIF